MLVDEEELISRIESPSNLLNRLNILTKIPIASLTEIKPSNPFTKVLDIAQRPDNKKQAISPCLPPTSDDVIDRLEEKITIGSIKGKAMGLMSSALDELKNKLPEVTKPERLSKIAADMGKIYDAVENRNLPPQVAAAQIIIYAPQIVSEDHFNVIDLQDR